MYKDIELVKDIDQYKRDIDPIKHYQEQARVYLEHLGYDDETIRSTLELAIKRKKDRMVIYWERDVSIGDTEVKKKELCSYLKEVEDNNEIMAPSGTTYTQKKDIESLHSIMQQTKKKIRKKQKEKKFKAKQEMEHDKSKQSEYLFWDDAQSTTKFDMNIPTGIYKAKSALHNPSNHSSLTSGTRGGTSLANAMSERFLAGNRHYHSVDVAMADINSIVTELHKGTNYKDLEEVINKYNIGIPSKDIIFSRVRDSCHRYWNLSTMRNMLRRQLNSLDDIELAAIMYTGDIYSLRLYNDKLVRDIVSGFVQKITGDYHDDQREFLFGIPYGIMNQLHHIFSEEIQGMGIDYNEFPDEQISTMSHTAKNILSIYRKYNGLFRVLFGNRNNPASVAHIKSMIRRCVTMSDTDSTARSLQDWVLWYNRGIAFTPDSMGVSGSMVALTSMSMKNTLQEYTANIGVAVDDIDKLRMKSEFTWSVMAVFSVSKHYWASTVIQEGSSFSEFELEIKGVNLKSSNIPDIINRANRIIIRDIITVVTSGKLLDVNKYVNLVCSIEQRVEDETKKGNKEILRNSVIKEPSGYKNEDPRNNDYKQIIIWNDTFGKLRNHKVVAPTNMSRFPVLLGGKTKLNKWLDEMEDRELAAELRETFDYFSIVKRELFYVPTSYVAEFNVPDEITMVANLNESVKRVCNMLYITLESLAVYRRKGLTMKDSVDSYDNVSLDSIS